MDPGVESYIEQIPPAQRPLFDRLHAIILAAHPDAEVALAYDMPAYRVGKRRLNLGAWKHGVSVYGFRRDNDGGFLARHPRLVQREGHDPHPAQRRSRHLGRGVHGAPRGSARALAGRCRA